MTVAESDGWQEAPQVESPDLEAVRKLAFELVYDNMHFHEVAIADPFEAESYVQGVGQRLIALVGFPTGYRLYDGGVQTPPPNSIGGEAGPGSEEGA